MNGREIAESSQKWEGNFQIFQDKNLVNEWEGKSPSIVRSKGKSPNVRKGNLQ